MMLGAHASRQSVFRNFTLAGQPEVLSEVKLSGGNSLGGWMSHVYPSTMPMRLLAKDLENNKSRAQFDRYGNPVAQEPKKDETFDWLAKDGEILGRMLLHPGTKPSPSALGYFRPLRPGESLRYEFFYEPGKSHVHPALGRTAFLLEADGVKLHWLVDAVDGDWTGLAADNAVEDAAGRRADKLTLKDGDWNTLVMTTTQDKIAIELNGTPVYEANLPADQRLFSLFHYKDKSAVRVRNVVLSGPWSKEKVRPEETALATPAPAPAAARLRRKRLGEDNYAIEAREVDERSKMLPPSERYKALAAWVLPNESRPSFQLAGTNQPRDVLGVVDQPAQPPGRRVILGSQLDAPCLEMIAAAKEAGVLDELAERIAKLEPPAGDESFPRAQIALLAAVRAAQGRDAEAVEGLKSLQTGLAKIKPEGDPSDCGPEVIAIYGVLDRPALAAPASDLGRALLAVADGRLTGWWERASRDAAGRAIAGNLPRAEQRPYGSDPGFAHWAPFSLLSSGVRTEGLGTPHWVETNGIAAHFPGHGNDYLALRTPLQGDFEVTCRLRLGNEMAHVRYGPYMLELIDPKLYTMHSSLAETSSNPLHLTPPMKTETDSYEFRLAVKDGTMRIVIDGRELFTENVGGTPDPWLMLRSAARKSGEVRNLKISGNPRIPDRLDLLRETDLASWKPYFGHVYTPSRYRSNGSAETGWQMRGEELFQLGKTPDAEDVLPTPIRPREYPESVIHYQRPMLEDGVIEYEFYYEPNKSHVHPALDRLVFLLEPGGVKLHWLTDGTGERSAVTPDNAKDEPTCRRGPSELPLKPKEWNRVRLSVTGDVVKAALNGIEVYERPIESTNQRFFGLFHYTDRTQARIRNVTYTGDWPKTLPAADKLFEKTAKSAP